MAIIYKLIDSKSLVMCESCLDEHGPVAGKWEESPFEECSICGAIDTDTREEYDQWSTDLDQQAYYDDDPNPYHGNYSED